jgi:hypothetical protein
MVREEVRPPSSIVMTREERREKREGNESRLVFSRTFSKLMFGISDSSAKRCDNGTVHVVSQCMVVVVNKL